MENWEKMYNEIPILGGVVDENVLSRDIAINALRTMTETLVNMEKSGRKEDFMIQKCVWPILYEVSMRFEKLDSGDFNVPIDEFDLVVG